MLQFVKVLFFTAFIFVNNLAYAQERSFSKESGKSFLLGFSKNYPVGGSKNNYGPSIPHPIMGIRHVSENWILGISAHFKFLEHKHEENRIALWALQEELNYKFRLYHPLYFLIGAKFLYIYPVQRGTYPFKKKDDYGPEIGIAATSSLLYFLPRGYGIGVFADLWRGTASRKFQAWEGGVHIMIPLNF